MSEVTVSMSIDKDGSRRVHIVPPQPHTALLKIENFIGLHKEINGESQVVFAATQIDPRKYVAQILQEHGRDVFVEEQVAEYKMLEVGQSRIHSP